VPLFRELVLAPGSRVREVFDLGAVEGLLCQHLARRWNWHAELWSILWLELWYREVLEGLGRASRQGSAARYSCGGE
jgi:hypothetical protein